ncbi:NifU family protein [bacterium]|nr:NifU family protein [bacterium]
MDPIAINLEFTPNPNTLKFVVNRTLVERGAVNFLEASKASKSPLALKLFEIPGVSAVMLGTHFVTITKNPTGDWDVLAERVPGVLETHLTDGKPVFDADFELDTPVASDASDVERKIREILDTDIRPAVAMDGGDITFDRYEDGVVYLEMRGSCSSCAHSSATLKMGVETRLKDAIPEIKEVVQI